jgi:hypothetical protein
MCVQVELMLNRSLENRQIESSVADKRKSDLKSSFAAIEAQHKVQAVEMAIEMAADASSASINGSDDRTAAASRVYAPPPQPDQGGVTSSPASNRKVRVVKARLVGEDDNDKYGARDRRFFSFFLLFKEIWFGTHPVLTRAHAHIHS